MKPTTPEQALAASLDALWKRYENNEAGLLDLGHFLRLHVETVKRTLGGEAEPSLPDWMVIDAVRYAIGRQSYQVGVTCRWLVENWQRIPKNAQDVIRRDVEEAKARDDRHRLHGSNDPVDRGPYFPLGSDIDRREWLGVLALATGGSYVECEVKK